MKVFATVLLGLMLGIDTLLSGFSINKKSKAVGIFCLLSIVTHAVSIFTIWMAYTS